VGLKPKLSLGVKSARVGFKPIMKKARGFVIARCELNSAVSESGLGSGLVLDLGTILNPGTGPNAVLNPFSDPSTVSLPFHFPVTSVASSAAVQEKIFDDHVDLGHGSAMSKPLNFYFRKSMAKRGSKVSAATKEWMSDTLGLTGMPPPVAQVTRALEIVGARWWKMKAAGLVLGAGSGFSLL